MTAAADTMAPPEPPRTRNRLAWLHFSAFVLLLAAWTVALLMPVPQEAAEELGGDEGKFWFSKSMHVATYAFLAFLGATLPLSLRWRLALLAVLSLHAFSTEFFQQFVGRSASWRDVGLDHVGIVLGIAVSWRWWRGRFRTDARPPNDEVPQ
jgi:VanZ family protein